MYTYTYKMQVHVYYVIYIYICIYVRKEVRLTIECASQLWAFCVEFKFYQLPLGWWIGVSMPKCSVFEKLLTPHTNTVNTHIHTYACSYLKYTRIIVRRSEHCRRNVDCVNRTEFPETIRLTLRLFIFVIILFYCIAFRWHFTNSCVFFNCLRFKLP